MVVLGMLAERRFTRRLTTFIGRVINVKLERLISIIYKLLNHEVLSASALAEQFNVSQRTIYRDIDAICAAGIPVVSYQGASGGYGIMDGYKMDRSLLGSYDVESLVSVLYSMSSLFEDEQIQGTIERLQTIGKDREGQALSLDIGSRWLDHASLRMLRSAIRNPRVIRFDYVNAKNERSSREMEPVRLLYKHGTWYVYGWCRTRGEYREFRISRMTGLSVTAEAFQRRRIEGEWEERTLSPGGREQTSGPERIGSGHERKNGSGQIGRGQERKDGRGQTAGPGQAAWWEQTDDPERDGMEEVTLLVSADALARAMDHFPDAHKRFEDGGTLTMKLSVYKPAEARWLWAALLSMGEGVEITHPLELRTVMKAKLEKMLKRYEEV